MTYDPRPPLGCKPRKLWLEERIAELEGAIARYDIAGVALPDDGDWIDELDDRRDELMELRKPEITFGGQLYAIPQSAQPITLNDIQKAKDSIVARTGYEAFAKAENSRLGRNYCREILNQWQSLWLKEYRHELNRMIFGQSFLETYWKPETDALLAAANRRVCTEHSPVDTGMRKSWCKDCNANMAMDANGAWVEARS